MAASRQAQELAEQLIGYSPKTSVAEGVLSPEMGGASSVAQYGGFSDDMMLKVKDFYAKNKMLVLIGGAVAVAAVAGGIGYYMYKKNHPSTNA